MTANGVRGRPVGAVVLTAAALVAGALVSGALVSGAAVSNALVSEARGEDRLRVGVNLTTIETLPVWLAAEDPAGAPVAISGGGIPALMAGAVDLATHAETQAVRYSPQDPGVRVILTVSEYHNHLVARRQSGITAAADLRGRRIATVPDTTAHYALAKTLKAAALTERDVTVVAMAPPDMPAALARGDVDAVSIWEPAALLSARALGDDAVILDAAGYRERFDLNTTVTVLADPVRRAAVVDLVRAVMAAGRRVREHPGEVEPVIAARLGLPLEVVAAAWDRFRFPAALADDLAEAMTEQEPWLASRQNRPPRTPAAIAALIDDSVWREAGRTTGASSPR